MAKQKPRKDDIPKPKEDIGVKDGKPKFNSV